MYMWKCQETQEEGQRHLNRDIYDLYRERPAPFSFVPLPMSGLFVIVDDQDPDIRYSPGWGPTSAAISFEYGGTITSAGPDGSTAQYIFNGTSISLFARVGANSNNATTTLTVAIDDTFVNSTVLTTAHFERFHEPLFTSPTLKQGTHTFTLTLSNVTSSDLCLDYLIYEATPNSVMSSASRLLVLNTNPQLAYSQGWDSGVILRPGLTQSAVSLNTSVERAADLGATVAFNFTGSGYELRGLLVTPFPSPVAAYSLDGAPFVDVHMPPNGTDYTNAVSNFEFIGQTFNEVGTHSLIITPLIPSAFFLDYIIVQSPTASFPQKADIAALPGPSLTSVVPPATKVTRLDAGAIAAIVLGVVLSIGIVCVTWYLLHRRKTLGGRWRSQNERSQDRVGDLETATSGVTPYTVVTGMPAVSKRNRQTTPAALHVGNSGSRGVASSPPAYSDWVMIRTVPSSGSIPP
ncbi:hypothetical protein C8R43DRAFT_5652 [Mycena crocata]|nr:hypothetical protein C8R43DRAFT_5652 [Mycena crocata]